MPSASFVRLPGLRVLRLQSLLTQQQLADSAGISRVTLIRIENGGPTKVSTAAALAQALGIRPPEIQVLAADQQHQADPADQ